MGRAGIGADEAESVHYSSPVVRSSRMRLSELRPFSAEQRHSKAKAARACLSALMHQKGWRPPRGTKRAIRPRLLWRLRQRVAASNASTICLDRCAEATSIAEIGQIRMPPTGWRLPADGSCAFAEACRQACQARKCAVGEMEWPGPLRLWLRHLVLIIDATENKHPKDICRCCEKNAIDWYAANQEFRRRSEKSVPLASLRGCRGLCQPADKQLRRVFGKTASQLEPISCSAN